MNESVRVSLILVSSIRQTNRSAFNRSATHGNLPPSMEEDYVRALSYGMPPAGGGEGMYHESSQETPFACGVAGKLKTKLPKDRPAFQPQALRQWNPRGENPVQTCHRPPELLIPIQRHLHAAVPLRADRSEEHT